MPISAIDSSLSSVFALVASHKTRLFLNTKLHESKNEPLYSSVTSSAIRDASLRCSSDSLIKGYLLINWTL